MGHFSPLHLHTVVTHPTCWAAEKSANSVVLLMTVGNFIFDPNQNLHIEGMGKKMNCKSSVA